MIQLTELGTTGLDRRTIDVDEKEISSVSADPVEESRTIVTMSNGTWFLVAESVSQVEALMETP